jgi:hypothetical protein
MIFVSGGGDRGAINSSREINDIPPCFTHDLKVGLRRIILRSRDGDLKFKISDTHILDLENPSAPSFQEGKGKGRTYTSAEMQSVR